MKYYFYLLSFLCLLASSSIKAQNNIGIGINTPNEKLHVDSGHVRIGNSVWFDSTYNKYLKFGDGNFATIGEEYTDDVLSFKANNFRFSGSAGYLGNVGIGTTAAPTAKLHVVGTTRIEDGTQGAGKVLTSDFSGNASWQTPIVTPTLALKVCIAVNGVFPSNGGSSSGTSPDTYIGEIKVFPYNFVPDGWLECKGQLLSIAQNVALFSLLGTQYGGNGTTNFALPNLTGKVIIGQ